MPTTLSNVRIKHSRIAASLTFEGRFWAFAIVSAGIAFSGPPTIKKFVDVQPQTKEIWLQHHDFVRSIKQVACVLEPFRKIIVLASNKLSK